jgi:hypothetical protein
MRKHLRLGVFGLWEVLVDYFRDLAVQFLAATLEQRVISRVLYQRVLECVGCFRWRTSSECQP